MAISLIPYTYHVRVIASACRMKVDVVTTSYISPAMQELEPKIKEAGICVMNEIGVHKLPPSIISPTSADIS